MCVCDYGGSEATQTPNLIDPTIDLIAFALLLDEFFLGDQGNSQQGQTRNAIYSNQTLCTVLRQCTIYSDTNHSNTSTPTSLSSFQNFALPLFQSLIPSITRNSFHCLRRARLAREQTKSRNDDLPDSGSFNTNYCGTLHSSTRRYRIHMKYCWITH